MSDREVMSDIERERVRELLRDVKYPGYSRDIIAAGFVGEIVVVGRMVEIEFKPNTRDEEKIELMEDNIRRALDGDGFVDIQIRRVHPFLQEVPLRSAKDLAASLQAPSEQQYAGASRLMTPLQAEMLEDGQLPDDDVLGLALNRTDVAPAAGYGPDGPQPLSGPREEIAYESDVEVLQWSIDPHDPLAETFQQEVRLGDWDYRVWWQVHDSGDLLYVSMQALREDWASHDENAVPHPIGRSEAVNLVYDEIRHAVVAIYGTVRDFRPFVKAFGLAYASERGSKNAPATEEANDQ